MTGRDRIRWGCWVGGLTACALIIAGGVIVTRRMRAPCSVVPAAPTDPGSEIPVSKLPGPQRRAGSGPFLLDATNSQGMTGMDDARNERWADIAGNFYSSEFIRSFRYSNSGPRGPGVRIRIEPSAVTLRGRLEARGLKPNFAYQVKLRGIYSADRAGFEAIGYAGRWRMPGRPTNYTDLDYEWYPCKEDVEAYILFDFFATDGGGDAIREFALDSSLHVLFNASRQGSPGVAEDLLPIPVEATDPALYGRPKGYRTVELLWAEREHVRYRSAGEVIRLPPGAYHAELILTEESFHSSDSDGGYWATVYKAPIHFEIVGSAESNQKRGVSADCEVDESWGFPP